MILLAFSAITKEEFALLIVGMFVVIFILERDRRYIQRFIYFSLWAIFCFVFIELNQTYLNRTNEQLFQKLLSVLSSDRPLNFVSPHYYLFFIGSLLFFGWVLIYERKIKAIPIALFLGGFIKLVSSFLVFDFDLSSWHNAPAVFMITASIAMYSIGSSKSRGPYVTLTIVGVICFCYFQVPALYRDYTYHTKLDFSLIKTAFYEIEKDLDPLRVASVYKHFQIPLSKENKRSALYPRGVHKSPRGIADYIVLPFDHPGIQEIPPCYQQFKENAGFNAYVKTGECLSLNEHRKKFIDTFGLKSIGY